MKRISGGQTSVGADAKLLSSHAGDPRAATGDTTDTSHTGQRNSGRSAASYGVSPLPARGSTGRVGRHRPSARTLTQRPVIRNDRLEGLVIVSRFPAAFRLPAFRFSVIRFPPGDWAFLTVGLPDQRSGPRRGYRVPHARATTGVGAPSTPRTAVLLPAKATAQPAPAASQRPVLAPSYGVPSAGLCFTRHQRGFTQFTRPVIPLACGRPDGTGRPWAFPRASNPVRRNRPTHVGAGTGRRARTWHIAYGISRTSNLA